MKVRKSANPTAFIGAIFFVIGMIFFLAGLMWLVSYFGFMQNSVKTEAMILDIQSHRSGSSTYHDVTVIYMTEDYDVYSEELGYYTAGMKVGDTINIYYDPDDPERIQGGKPVGQIIVIAVGLPFALVGVIVLSTAVKASSLKKRLKRDGDLLTGTIINVVQEKNVRINGRHPLKAEVEVIDPYSGDRYLYSSEGVMNDIYGFIGAAVSVYVDRNDKSKYYVNIDDLSELCADDAKVHDYR